MLAASHHQELPSAQLGQDLSGNIQPAFVRHLVLSFHILILVGQKDGRGGAVCLGDDPKLCIVVSVGGEEPSAVSQGAVIAPAIFLTESTPVPLPVAGDSRKDLLR